MFEITIKPQGLKAMEKWRTNESFSGFACMFFLLFVRLSLLWFLFLVCFFFFNFNILNRLLRYG